MNASMPRGLYTTVPDVDRERIVSAFQAGRDWLAVAEALSVKRQTARSIIVSYRQHNTVQRRPQGGHRYCKIDDEMLQFFADLIEQKPTSTLKEMVEQSRLLLPNKPQITTQALSKRLDGIFYTTKTVQSVPAQWNTPQRKQERRAFAEWQMGPGALFRRVFVDEFGVNVWTSRRRGRARRGDRAVRVVEGQRGSNVTICLAVSEELGLVHYVILNGGMTQAAFSDFLMEVSELLMYDGEEYIILCDNASCHLNAPHLGDHCRLMYLPKYAPYLNACEMAGSCLKAAAKRRLGEADVQAEIYNRAAPREETLENRRKRILRRELETAINKNTQPKCAQWARHVTTYIPKCLREEDIFE
jgi:transposase